jgi:hypothetical protein
VVDRQESTQFDADVLDLAQEIFISKLESVGLALSLLGYGLMVCGGGCTHLLGLHPGSQFTSSTLTFLCVQRYWMTASPTLSTAAYSVAIGEPSKGVWMADDHELTPSGGIPTLM